MIIANFFNQSKPINFLILTIASVIIFIEAIYLDVYTDGNAPVVYRLILNLFLFLLIVFLHNFLTRKNGLTKNNTYALYLFVLLFAIFPKSIVQYNILLSNFFLFFSYRRIYSLRTSLNTKNKIYDAGFWIGIAAIFYNYSALFLILGFAAIILFGKSRWNHFFIILVGFFTPLFLYFTFLFATDGTDLFFRLLDFEKSFDYANYNNFRLLFPISILLVFTGWAIYPTLRKSLKSKKKYKALYNLLLLHLFLAMVIGLMAPLKNGSEYLFFFFPFSIIFTSYLQTIEDRWFKELVMILFLVLSVSVFFFY